MERPEQRRSNRRVGGWARWALAGVAILLVAGMAFAAIELNVVQQSTPPPERGVVVTTQGLDNVNYTSTNLVAVTADQSANDGSPSNPIFLPVPAIPATPQTATDIATVFGFADTQYESEVIELTFTLFYTNGAGAQVVSTSVYVAPTDQGQSVSNPETFSVAFDLGAAYSLTTTDVVLTALPGVTEVLPGVSFYGPTLPAGATVEASVTGYVTDDMDSGYNAGYWAIDNYSVTFTVYAVGGNQYFIQTFLGTSTVIKGATSPGASDATEGGWGVATMDGWFNGTVAAGVFDPTLATNGFVGNYNYGGAPALYATGPTSPFDWVGAYISGGSSADVTNYALIYHYETQTWVDADSVGVADSGDIVVA